MKEKIKTWIFNIRMKRAIRRADELAKQLRCKVLILNINGKPVVTTMQRIRELIKQKQIKGTPEYYRSKALYTAMPRKSLPT